VGCLRADVLAFSREGWPLFRVLELYYLNTLGSLPRPPCAVCHQFVPEAALAIVCPIKVLCSYWQDRGDEGLQPPLEQLIRNANAARVLRRRKRVLDHVFHIQIRPDLVQILS